MEGLALKVSRLKQIINGICSEGPGEISDDCLQEILQQIKLVFNEIRKCRLSDNIISDILEFLNVINNVAEVSLSVKSEVVSSCIVSILELITRGDISFSFKVEILKLTNVLLENCQNITKESLLTITAFEKLIVKFGRQLDTVGDYEYQVGLIECLFRIIPKKFRPKYGKHLFSDELLLEQFLDIRDHDFETDCRTFLNNYNNAENQKQRVRSIPCISAFLGDQELRKPSDPGYDDFWVDFNFGSGRLTIFCEDYNSGRQDFSDDGSWETLSVWKSDTQRYQITADEGHLYLDIELVNPIPTLYPSQTAVLGKIVSFTFDSMWSLEEAALQTLGGDKWFKEPPKTKVSLPTTSVCIRTSGSPDFEMDSNYDQLDEEIGNFQHPSVDQNCPVKFSVPTQPPRVKVSVPCAAVVLDSSQNSVVEPVQAIAMKYVQSLKPEGMSALQPEEGMCADDELECVSFGDLKSSPATSKASEPVSCVNLGFGRVVKKSHQKSAGISTPKTPTNRGLSKVKVKTPVAVLTPNEGKKRRKTLKKKQSASKPSMKSSNSQADEENQLVSFPDSCPGNDENRKVHAGQRAKVSSQSKENTVLKEQTNNAKGPTRAKNNSFTKSVSIPDTVVHAKPQGNSSETVSKKSKAEKMKTRNKGPIQDNKHESNVLETVEKKSAEAETAKEDFIFNSQDSLINEDTCKEIYSLEQDGLSFTEEWDKDSHYSLEECESKTFEDCEEKESHSKVIKKREQTSTKKKPKSKKGKNLKVHRNRLDQEVQNDIEVAVIQSSCDLENGQKFKSSTSNSDEPLNQDFNCGVNKNVIDNKGDSKISKDKSKNKTTSKNASDKSDSGVLNCDTEDLIPSMTVSATFGKGFRKKNLSKQNKAHCVGKIVEKRKTRHTNNDNGDPIVDSMDASQDTCTVVNSKSDKQVKNKAQSKKQINNKGDSEKADLDVYDFNEVDEISRSFFTRKRTDSCKNDKRVECEISVQSENDTASECTNECLPREKTSRKRETKKDKEVNICENDELNTTENCDKEVVCSPTKDSAISQPDKTSISNKGKKAVQKNDMNSTEQGSRKTRSSRQRKQHTTKTCAEDSPSDKEIEVVQSSFDPENDGVMDNRKSSMNTVVPPVKEKQNRNKQLLVSTPLNDVDADMENLNGENEECSNSHKDKGYIEHLEKQNVNNDQNILAEKRKQRVGHSENKESNQQTGIVQKGKYSSKRGNNRPGKQKQETSLKNNVEDEAEDNAHLEEDLPPLSKKHESHGNTVMNEKTMEVDECYSDAHGEDDSQSAADGLVFKKDSGTTKARMDRKSRKSKNVEFGGVDENANEYIKKNTEKRKTKINKGKHTASETTADIVSVEQSSRKTRSNVQRKHVVLKLTKDSDTESQDDNKSEVIHSSNSSQIDVVLNINTGSKDVTDIHSDKKQGLGDVDESNPIRDDGQIKQLTVGDEEEEINYSPPDQSSLSLFSTNLSQGNTIKSQSQRKFFKERSGSTIYEKHNMQSACVSSAAGVQTKKSCEVEYGNSKNRVYLAMSYSSSDRINLPSEKNDTVGDPYDFDEECERFTKPEKYKKKKPEYNSKDLQGQCETQTHPSSCDALLKKKKNHCKESINPCIKDKQVAASDLGENKKRSKPRPSHNKDGNINLSKYSRKNVDLVNTYPADDDTSEQDSDCLEKQTMCLQKYSKSKTPKFQKDHHKKHCMISKNVNQLMGRLLNRKRNVNTCQDSNEEEEYDHHDALCLSKGDSTSPVKIPHCEITLDEIVGIPRLHRENNHLPCFKHHEHQHNQCKRARLENPKTTDTTYSSDLHSNKKRETTKNHKSRSANTRDMKKAPTKDVRRTQSDQGPNTLTKNSFTEEIETIDSEISEDQLYRSDDVSIEEELPPENGIITRFNQFCKKMVGNLEEDVRIEKTRKETSSISRKKENSLNRKNSDDAMLLQDTTSDPRTPKFVIYDPEDQVEICSIKTPMTLPCSDIEVNQESVILSDDEQIQPQKESPEIEHNRNRGSRSFHGKKNTDPSGFKSGYSSEIRPSRSSLKRKYDSMNQCDDEDDVCRNYPNAGYDLSDTLEMCQLKPRRLFSSDFKAVVEITGSSDDEEDKDDLYGQSEHNASSQESIHNRNRFLSSSTSHLEGTGLDAGVSAIVKAFGLDFKKQMQTKQHCLDVLSKTVLKSSQRHLRNMFTDRTQRRANILERFGQKLLAELTALGMDVRSLEDSEAKTLDFFQQQMKVIKKCRVSQEKRLENLKKMQLDFVASMCHMDQYESNQQKTYKNAMKKDLAIMQRKLLADAQRHELTTVRRSLHTMIG